MRNKREEWVTHLSEKESFLLAQGYFDKYTNIVVSGKPVRLQQAKEIIRVTDNFYYWLQGKESKRLANLLHIPYIDQGNLILPASLDQFFLWLDRWGVLPVKFAANHFIAKSYQESDGWCQPNGMIYQVSRIGRYPDSEAIYCDWREVAERFSFLDLGVSIFNDSNIIGNATEIKELPKDLSLRIQNGICEIVDWQKVNVHAEHPETIDRPSFVSAYYTAIFENNQEIFDRVSPMMQQQCLPWSWIEEWAIMANQLFDNND